MRARVVSHQCGHGPITAERQRRAALDAIPAPADEVEGVAPRGAGSHSAPRASCPLSIQSRSCPRRRYRKRRSSGPPKRRRREPDLQRIGADRHDDRVRRRHAARRRASRRRCAAAAPCASRGNRGRSTAHHPIHRGRPTADPRCGRSTHWGSRCCLPARRRRGPAPPRHEPVARHRPPQRSSPGAIMLSPPSPRNQKRSARSITIADSACSKRRPPGGKPLHFTAAAGAARARRHSWRSTDRRCGRTPARGSAPAASPPPSRSAHQPGRSTRCVSSPTCPTHTPVSSSTIDHTLCGESVVSGSIVRATVAGDVSQDAERRAEPDSALRGPRASARYSTTGRVGLPDHLYGVARRVQPASVGPARRPRGCRRDRAAARAHNST